MNLTKRPFIATVLPMGVRSAANKLVVSCCLNINKYYEGFAEPATVANAYNEFYAKLQNLREALSKPTAKVTIKCGSIPTNLITVLEVPPNSPAADPLYYLSAEEESDLNPSDYANLRDGLWKRIFPHQLTGPNPKEIDGRSRVPNPQVGSEIVSMTSTEELPLSTDFVNRMALKANLMGTPKFTSSDPSLPVDQKLARIREFGITTERRALTEKLEFVERYTPEPIKARLRRPIEASDIKGMNQLAGDISATIKAAVTSYLSPEQLRIDIDEIINNFSSLSREPALMRVMGLIRDFEITLPSQFVPPTSASVEFYLAVDVNSDAFSIPTRITGINQGGKYAYQVTENKRPGVPQFFSNSILKVLTERVPAGSGDPWQSHIYQYDKVAQELRVQAANETSVNNSGAFGEDRNDGFTRGLIFGNTGLTELIKPADYTFTSAGNIADDFAYSADFVSHGHRVAVVIDGTYHSLTGRRLELKRLADFDDDDPFFVSDRNEGCIHFDAVSNFIENDKLKSCAADALFEYSGELLALKSAFSRAVRNDGPEKNLGLIEANDDGGLFKSQQRVKEIIEFTTFPEEAVKKKKEAFLGCHYDIPRYFTREQSPKLRFWSTRRPSTYTFAVYEEYMNGWALPLKHDDKRRLQLSVEDLTRGNSKYLPEAVKFTPVESKKPVLLIHTRDFNEGKYSDDVDETRRPIDQEALEDLVVWSEDASSGTHSCSRHVLPARIAFEHAFWYGLLGEMAADESFNWKKKYNCPFVDEAQFEQQTQGENKEPCPEDACSSYCGGTLMRSFYEMPNIVPSHLSDPSIVGFEVKFFRDREGQNQISHDATKVTFGGRPGLAPWSYMLDVDGSTEELKVRNWNVQKRLEIRLKKGLRIWAQLQNEVAAEYDHHLKRIWFHDLKHLYGVDLEKIEPPRNSKNPPRTISLVHAVKKPVIDPQISAAFSLPAESYKYKHVEEWMRREYPKLKIDENVVAQRLKMHEAEKTERGSTKVAVNLKARFERLDAYLAGNKVAYLPEELPTGALELWMRKEEFLDNPEQFVLDPKTAGESAVNHLPEEPVVPFENEANVRLREHNVEFTPTLLQQLKTADQLVPKPTGDIFRDVVSTVSLQFDARSACFEERRYRLRNVSLFKGYFTNKPEDSDDDYAADSAEHHVLFLNNRRPDPPRVSHVVTTIREERTKTDDLITSTQKGNIVTCYLNRGRLSSGKNERVGIIVYNAASRYHKVFKDADLISKTGRDIVSDLNKATASPFIRYDDTDKDIIISDSDEFDARFEKDLGLVSYLPKFDIERQLWKFELELDIKNVDKRQLHNPFVQFSLVHYQPYSINYNEKWAGSGDVTLADVERDFRLSAVESFVWCYLLPERTLTISFDEPGIWGLSWLSFLDTWGSVDLTLSFDYDSLHHFNLERDTWLLRSNFIVSVEGSNDKVAWFPVMSQPKDGGTEQLMHPLIRKEDLNTVRNDVKLNLKYHRKSKSSGASRSFSDFRVRIVEVEWFTEDEWSAGHMAYEDIVDNEGLRVRYVEVIY